MQALRRIFLLTGLIFGLAALAAPLASADTVGPITFEPPTYTLGDINGQNGWMKTGPYDVQVASVSLFPAAAGYGFGAQALRVSNAITSGSFGDQTFSPGLTSPAGESPAQTHFDATFQIGTTQATHQPDLRMTVSPDAGDGGRMSFLRFEDLADGVHVFFADVTNPGPLPTVSTFNTTDIATISRGAAHSIRFSIDFVTGPANDVAQIYVDGVLKKTGTTWEDYYRYDPEQVGNGNQVPKIAKLLIRQSGVPSPLTLGNGFLVDGLSLASSSPTANPCVFTFSGSTMNLQNDCTTNQTILIPNGFELRGFNHTITAIDPPGGHFVGAVVKNGGSTASVTRLKVTTSGLDDVCDAGDDRLRGIMLDGAAGRISFNTVTNVNQGQSGCQEGNGIEVRNAPFDGTHPGTKTVLVNENTVRDYQKTGILANGDVSVNVNHNTVGASFVDPTLIAANSVQLGFGAIGQIRNNVIDGNQYCGAQDTVGTAILLFDPSPGAVVSSNNIDGNSDIGIYVGAENASIDHNRVTDDPTIPDCNTHDYDTGIGNFGANDGATNDVSYNTVRGFDKAFEGKVGRFNNPRS